jgi:DNA-binding response OmpR family regulator
MANYTVLVVDDEKEIRDAIEIYLKNEGVKVLKAKDGVEALEMLHENEVHLILLDVMMPRLDGISATHRIREEKNIPIIILSAKSEDTDKILGLQVGADDYVTKPFSPKEVAFRVKAQLRRAGYSTVSEPTSNKIEKVISVGPFSINHEETEVMKDGEMLELTAKEVGLMSCFMRNPNHILSKETLFNRVWGEEFYGADNTLMVHIRRLREKIEDTPSKPTYIITVKGLGYRFIPK